MKLLIVDDHAVVRQGYSSLLMSVFAPCEVFEASSGEQAVELCRGQQPDIIIMDVNMQGMSGIDAGKAILSDYPAAKILCFSMHEETAVARQAIDVGIKGYITKSSPPNILLDAVKKVMAGGIYLQDDIASRLSPDSIKIQEERFESMTSREYEIFLLLAHGKNNAEISEKLNISQKTVSNYATVLKNKLNISSAAQLVHLAADAGLIHPETK